MKILEPLYIDTSTSPATIYMVNTTGDGYLEVGTWAANFGITAAKLGVPTVVKCTADVTNTTAIYANITGLTFAVEANKDYAFKYFIEFESNNDIAKTFYFAVNGPAAATSLFYEERRHMPSATEVFAIQTAYQTTVLSGIVNVANTKYIFRMEGTFRNGVNAGTFGPQFKTTTVSTLTVRRGSWGEYTKLN